MSVLRSSWLVIVAGLIFCAAYLYRPGGIEGPTAPPVPMTGKGFDHSTFDAVLAQARKADGSIDYGALATDKAALDRYLGQLRATSPTSAPHRFKSHADRLAYYLNAYNAFIMAVARDNCGSTIQNLEPGGGLYWRISFMMGEDEVTLSDLESELIGGVSLGDAAVHFAIVKAGKGFFPIGKTAYRGDTVEAVLKTLATDALKDPRIARRDGETLYLSKLLFWYQNDFGEDPTAWIKARAPALVEGNPKIEFTPFDWSLNGVCQ